MKKRKFPVDPKGFVVIHDGTPLAPHDGSRYMKGCLLPAPINPHTWPRRRPAELAVKRTVGLFHTIARFCPGWVWSRPELGDPARFQVVPVFDRDALERYLNPPPRAPRKRQ